MRYLLFVPGAVSVELVGLSVSPFRPLHWALGVLADGSFEVLGVWLGSAAGNSAWEAARVDLSARGVEKVVYVVPEEGEASLVVPRRYRDVLMASRVIVGDLQLSAARAVRRHGPFAGVDEAVSFVASALDRAERLLGDTAPIEVSSAGVGIGVGTRWQRPATGRGNGALLLTFDA